MGAYEEILETGALGPLGAEMLYRTVAAVARFDNYPPPEHYAAWTEDAIVELSHDFLAGERSSERLVHLSLLANDEKSFARLLEASVRNFFRSRARATERGKLHRRIRAVLEDQDEFVLVSPKGVSPQRWALRDHPKDPWEGRIDELIRAASLVPIAVVRWREGSGADRPSLRELCRRVLSEAGGSVALEDLVGVASLRLGLGRPPLTAEIEAPDTTVAVDVGSQAVAALAAGEVFHQLTPRERLLVLVLDESVREAAAFVGVSKSTAAEDLARLRSKLEALLPDVDSRLGTLRELERIAAEWADERTDTGDSAS